MDNVTDNSTVIETIETIIEENTVVDNVIAGTVIFTISLFGVAFNLLASLFLYRIRSLRGAFGFLCVSHSLAESGVLLIFVFWCAPNTYLQTDSWSFIGRKIGQLSLVFWFASLYAHLLIAINRFCAITAPSIYRTVFSDNKTFFLIMLSWTLAVVHGGVYFFPDCDFAYNSGAYYWEFAVSDCGNVIAYYLDFMYGTVICGIVLLLDVITVAMVHCRYTRKAAQTTTSMEQKRRNRRDMKFFIQACMTAVIFTVMLFSFHFLSKLAVTKWEVFLTTTFAWCLSHTLDGLVLILFHSELRKIILKPHRWLSSQAHGGVSHVSNNGLTRTVSTVPSRTTGHSGSIGLSGTPKSQRTTPTVTTHFRRMSCKVKQIRRI